MPELPDIELYLFALRPRIVGNTLQRVRLAAPFLLRSVEPPLEAAAGRTVSGVRRIGKRIVWELEGGRFIVFHLMIGNKLIVGFSSRRGLEGLPGVRDRFSRLTKECTRLSKNVIDIIRVIAMMMIVVAFGLNIDEGMPLIRIMLGSRTRAIINARINVSTYPIQICHVDADF